jgi:carbamoyltransferase
MRILGIHDGHNAAATLVIDGKVVAAVQEERFNRQKNWSGLPVESIHWVLNYGGIELADLDAVAMNGKHMPYPKDREALINEYRTTGSTSTNVKRLIKRTPLKTVYNLRRQNERLNELVNLGIRPDRVHFVEHHAAHAAAAYYGWGQYTEPVLVLTNDGAGDGLCASVNTGHNGQLKRIAGVNESESIGNIYAVITFMMGMIPLEHEYKLMGLAPYAPESGRDSVLKVLRPLLRFQPENCMSWNRADNCPETYYSYNFLRQRLELKRFDWICAGLQTWTEELLAQWVRNCIQATGIHKVALSGGVFMNVKANKIISELPDVESLFIFPSCGDETNAIGAAYWVEAKDGIEGQHIPPVKDLYWGQSFDNNQIEMIVRKRQPAGKWIFKRLQDIDTCVAELLAQGEIVARFAGRAEFGARALGNRSILADASKTDVIREINEMVKSRDFWMPFAPAILEERAPDYIVNPKGINAPYMILSFDTTPRVNDLLAAIHPYDLTARPQIVNREWNPAFHKLLKEFERLTGRGVVLNTSFNLHGFPIVNSPEDAIDVLEKSGLKYLALGEWLLTKNVEMLQA